MEANNRWDAKWIWTGDEQNSDKHKMIYFRRTFSVPEKPSKLIVKVSADSRYRLYLNGKSVCVGPLKGDHQTHYYETVDLSNSLISGDNVLAAKVIHYSITSTEPSSESIWRSPKGGFLLEGTLQNSDGEDIEILHSNDKWKYIEDDALQFEAESWLSSHWLGGVERVDGNKLPQGWESIYYDDNNWKAAVPFLEPQQLFGLLTPWQLTERVIPFLYEREKTFPKIMRTEGNNIILNDQDVDLFSTGKPDLELHAGEHYMVELDAGELTTGYLNIRVSGGSGTKIRMLASECYEKEDVATGSRIKGVRDEISEGSKLLGDSDIYLVAGKGSQDHKEVYEPFWWRSFRFVRLEIEVGHEPMTLHSFNYRETGYPLDVKAEFSSSDQTMTPLWDVSVRTLKRCMHETYEDCPYYEQLQYTMDTRLQILFTYTISGDDRLARKAIYDYHSSLLPSGMLQSRYPSVLPQIIPGFSIYWILMVHDHYRYFGDAKLVKRYRSSIDAVLEWFDRRVSPQGLIDNLPDSYWNFVDWVKEWPMGIPPAHYRGPITAYSLMYALALEKAAELNEWTGRTGVAEEYRERAEQLKEAVRIHCWSNERKMFRDGPNVEEYSQQVQIMSVLANTLDTHETANLMKKTLEEKSISQVSYSMAFFLFRALDEAGLYNQSFELWDTWRDMLKMNLTTWMEDPVGMRSDCHAWGATPLYEFPAHILGVQPDLPGYKRVLVEPQVGDLAWAKGSVVTLRGLVTVDWRIIDNEFFIKIDGPKDLPLRLKMPDGTTLSFVEITNVEQTCQMPRVTS